MDSLTKEFINEEFAEVVITSDTALYVALDLSGGGKTVATSYNAVKVANAIILPGVPGSVTVSQAATGLQITWTVASSAASYNLWRSTSSGAETLLASGVTSGVIDTAISPNTTYYYLIAAINSAGTTFSAEASGIALAPTGVVLAVRPNGLEISWTAVSGATSYKLYRGTVSGSTTLLTAGVTSPSLDTTATPGTTYYYTITAVITAGETSKSSEVSGSVLAGLAWWFATDQTLYKDTSGTVPATVADDVVADVPDHSGNANHCIQATASKRALLKLALQNSLNGLTFDSDDQYQKASATGLNPSDNLFFVAVVKTPASFGDNYIYGANVVGGWEGHAFGVDSSGKLFIDCRNSGSSGQTLTSTMTALSTSTTYLLAFQFKAGQVRFWKNGVLQDTKTAAGTTLLIDGTGLTFSGYQTGAGYWHGSIFEGCFFGTSANTDASLNNFMSALAVKWGFGVPLPPASISSSVSGSAITITWSGVVGATSYNIYRGTVSGTLSLLASGVSSPYSNYPALPNTTYYYAVTSVGSNGESNQSSEVSGSVTIATLVDDVFSDTNLTPISNHTISPVNGISASWVHTSGGQYIQDGFCRVGNGPIPHDGGVGYSWNRCWVNLGVTDYTIAAWTTVVVGTDGLYGPSVRHDMTGPAGSFYQAALDGTSATLRRVFLDANGDNIVSVPFAWSVGQEYKIAIKVSGTTLTLYIDDVDIGCVLTGMGSWTDSTLAGLTGYYAGVINDGKFNRMLVTVP